MCGRYSIYESMDHYLKTLAPQQLVINGYDLWPIERYNVAPTKLVEIIRPVPGGLSVDRVRWGWAPHWAKGKGPVPINARVENVMEGRFFKALWPNGRALAPANGWFEWVKDPDNPQKKTPYFIRLKADRPMFFAALAEVQSGMQADQESGFVILTTANDQGMSAIHDRQPLVLAPEQAREWIDPQTSPQRAAQIMQTCQSPSLAFTWHRVGVEVGNVKADSAQLIEAVDEVERGEQLALFERHH